MSNNIYDILKKMQNLEVPKQSLTESKKAKPDYIDIDKDGDKKEPMKKAAREKSKGAVAEAIATVERQLSEKYMGFKKAAAAGKKLGEDYQSDMKARDKASRAAEFEKDLDFVQSGGAHRDTGGVEYDRHGNPAFDVNTRRKLEKDRTYPVYRHPGIGKGMPDRPVPDQMEEGEPGVAEGEYNEDMLSPAQKKFAALAEPKDKITYADKIAGAKKKSMAEGWEEMQKYLEKKRGPESKGGEGKKAGTRYGGSAQKDDDEDVDGEGKPVEKKKGRPKGTGGGAKFSFKKPKD
jgi:hypothetical protein